MSETVLVVEDEPDLARAIERGLRAEGISVRTVSSGREALAAVTQEWPGAVLLDLNLPDVPGAEVCRALKADSATRLIPILIASARGSEADRVFGFLLGADDYVQKPFSVREVALRLRGLLRRSLATSVALESVPERLERGRLVTDLARHRAWWGEKELDLTPLEFRLLRVFLEQPGRVFSRQHLLDTVWRSDLTRPTRTVDIHVARLRQSLGEAGRYIETVRGVGYRLAEREESERAGQSRR